MAQLRLKSNMDTYASDRRIKNLCELGGKKNWDR
ncbi:hypothetical protein ES703_40062 [subsurface metagenome]